MAKPRVQVIVGSVRAGRISRPIADWVMRALADHPAFEAELVDLLDWDLPMLALPKPPAAGYTEEYQQRWAAKVAEADAYLLVAPEYNHAVSPVLKNALDTVYAEWARKPVAFVSHGTMGGVRAVGQLIQVAVALNMAPLKNGLMLQGASHKREGDTWNGDESDAKRLAGVLDDLAWWTNALKAAR